MIQYFSHDINARNDEKILRLRMKLGAAGYGIYFMLLERLASDPSHTCSTDYDILAYELREESDVIKSVVEDFALFILTNDNTFYSESMMRRCKDRDRISAVRSEAGKKGANAKQSESKCLTNTEQMSSKEETTSKQTLLKENKENKKNKNISPPPSPLEATGVAEEDKLSYIDSLFVRYEKAMSAISKTPLRAGVMASDLQKLARFLSSNKLYEAIYKTIFFWRADAPYYECLQYLKGKEDCGEIDPIPHDIWCCLIRLNTLRVSDIKEIKQILRQDETKLYDLTLTLKEIEKNDGIRQPARYIISKLKGNG